MLTLKINNQEIRVNPGDSVLKAALSAGIYIPHLCSHPDLDDYKCLSCGGNLKPASIMYQGDNSLENDSVPQEPGCKLCLVEINGIDELQKSCATIAAQGMEVSTDTEKIRQARQDNLAKILSEHPHSCLTCAQSEGCSLTQCSSNVPQNERCCPKFGRCELQKISRYIGIPLSTPRYVPKGISTIETDPLFKRDYNLCIGCLRCVRACQNLRGVDALGFVINQSKTRVGSRRPPLNDSGCKFCGACVEVCPTGAIMDKVTVSADKRHKKKSLVPCQDACPAGMDAPNYIRLIKEARLDEALKTISHKVPLPSVLGRVCFHPCEDNCRRKELNDPISICALKRYAADNAPATANDAPALPIRPDTIAVIGSGPAGLSAAYYLAKKGYPVTIFESEPEIGGMMRYAIPEYRLPLSTLHNDLNKIIKHPHIKIKNNSRLGLDFTLDSLKKDGFKAILLAIGAQAPKKIPGDKISAPVLWGIDFLKSIRRGKTNPAEFKGKSILVIGGGNVAIDVALSAKRLGAEKIQMVCLESRDEMPAHEWEINQALEEGIDLKCGWGPKNICQLPGNNLALEAIQCNRVFDETGKFNPSFNNNACDKFECQTIILAIGQAPDTSGLPEQINQNRTITVNENTLATCIDGVFACGEVAHNPLSVIEAIADGKKAAENIDKRLGGNGIIDQPIDLPKANPSIGRNESFAGALRIKTSCIELNQRNGNFMPVEIGFNRNQAEYEAGRCLQCDLRLNISPVIFPPELSKSGAAQENLDFTEENIAKAPAQEGVYVLLDEKKEVILIKGAINLQESLREQANNNKAKFFYYEIETMHTKKESELIQDYLAKHGKLPSGGDELDELY